MTFICIVVDLFSFEMDHMFSDLAFKALVVRIATKVLQCLECTSAGLQTHIMDDAQDSADSEVLNFEFYKPHLYCWWSQVFQIQEQIHPLPKILSTSEAPSSLELLPSKLSSRKDDVVSNKGLEKSIYLEFKIINPLSSAFTTTVFVRRTCQTKFDHQILQMLNKLKTAFT